LEDYIFEPTNKIKEKNSEEIIKEKYFTLDENKTDDSLKEEYLKDFILPKHNKNCKTCLGLGRIGYEYNPKTKTRKGIIPCPIYLKEIKLALKNHIEKINNSKPKEIKSFDDIITGNI